DGGGSTIDFARQLLVRHRAQERLLFRGPRARRLRPKGRSLELKTPGFDARERPVQARRDFRVWGCAEQLFFSRSPKALLANGKRDSLGMPSLENARKRMTGADGHLFISHDAEKGVFLRRPPATR